jgi:methionyl-tRNA formyltransferase
MLRKIVFMGTSNFAVPILKTMYQNGYEFCVVYTQPPQKSKRGQKINKSPVQKISEVLNLELRMPKTLKNNKEEFEYLNKLNADLAIVVAYGQIIPNDILNLIKKGFINIHASLLPKWRGAAPIQRALMNLDKQTGISIMKINNILDSGPICSTYKINVMSGDNAETISEKLSFLASEKILDDIDNILDEKVIFKNQNHKEATYANKIEKSEGKIDWKNSAENIIGKINGLYPSPGAWFLFNGERYKVLEAKIGNTVGDFGFVLDNSLEIGCGDNKSIKILTIQREGKKSQKVNEFMLGSQIKKGSNLNNA